MSGKKISIKLLSLLMSLVMIVTSIPLGAIATYAVTTSTELDRQLSYEKRYEGKKVSPETQAVYDFICDKYGSNMITAQQESTWVDNNPDWEMDYLKKNTGKLPAIRGFDYIGSNVDENSTVIATDNDFEGVNKRAIEWWRKGGIVTICWHTGSNFKGGYQNSKKDSPPDWDKVLTEGTAENKEFKEQMAQGAIALQELRDAGVPVLWRPFHEFDGGWFWWGKFKKNASTLFTGNWDIDNEKFKKLWKMMYDLYTNEYGLNNLIWVYGYSQVTSDPSGLYPGDEYVDILGPDNYEKNIVNLFNKVNGVNAKRPICLHECGTNPTQDQWNQAPYSYFMTWHTGWLTGSENNSSNTVDSLNQLYNSDLAITLDELPVFDHEHKAGRVEQQVTTPATCTTEGSYNDVTHCAYEKCKEIVSTEAKTIPPLGHSFTNYVFDNNKDENSEGTRTAYCDNGCGATNTVAVDPAADTKAIKDAMTAFEDKLKEGKVYTNLPDAYKAYVEASKAYDSYYYGGDTSVAVNKKAKELNDAVNKMQEWSGFAKGNAISTFGSTANKNYNTVDIDNTDAQYNLIYTKVIGTGQRVSQFFGKATYDGQGTGNYEMGYNSTVMLYDGTQPRMPVMCMAEYKSGKWGRYVCTHGIFPLNNADSIVGNDHTELEMIGTWGTGKNGNWVFADHFGKTNNGTAGYKSDMYNAYGPGFGDSKNYNGFANSLTFCGKFGENEYVKDYSSLSWGFYTETNSKKSGPDYYYKLSGTVTEAPIYVVNIVPLKTAMENACKLDVKNYKQGGLTDVFNAVESATAYNPNSAREGKNSAKEVADNFKTVVSGYTNRINSTEKTDSRYPALRIAMDKTMATYNAGRTSEYSVKSYNAFKVAYEEAMGVMSQVVNLGYEDESLGDLAEAAATKLEAAYKALPLVRPCDTHTWKLINATNPATCTENGYGDFICTVCEEPHSDVIIAPGHDYGRTYNLDKSKITKYCKVCKETFGEVDLTSYNSMVALANDALGRTDKYKDLKNLSETLSNNVAKIDSTQDEVDSYCAKIETAYKALELMEYSLTFIIMVGETVAKTEKATYKYGDVVPLNVGSKYNPYKWTREGYSSRIANATKEVSVVVYGETTVVAHCDGNAQAPANQHKVTIYNKFNKVVNFMYVVSGTELTFDGSTITANDDQEYKFEKTPFYQITGYKAGSNQLGSSATYTVNGDIGIYPIYSAQQAITITLDKTNSNSNSNIRFSDDAKALSKTVIWDQKITVEADQDVVWYVNKVPVAKGTSYTFRASNSITITAQTVETEKGSTTITYADYDRDNKKIRYAVSSYKSKDFVIAEQGIIVGTSTKSNATFEKEVIIKNGKKFVASKTTDTGDQFSYSISLGSSASIIKTICAVSYVKYENIDTPIYSDINYIYLDLKEDINE